MVDQPEARNDPTDAANGPFPVAARLQPIPPKRTPTMREVAVLVQPRPGRTDYQTRRPLGDHYI